MMISTIATVAATVLRLVGDTLEGRKSNEQLAKELLDAALASGVPTRILLEHLTQRGRERAELAADIVQWIKIHGRNASPP